MLQVTASTKLESQWWKQCRNVAQCMWPEWSRCECSL